YGAPKPLDMAGNATFLDRIEAGIEDMGLAMTARIQHPIAGPDGTIAAALITGERGAIPNENAQAYRHSRLGPLAPASGLHLALAGLGIFWTFRAAMALWPRLALTRPIKKWAAMAAIVAATFYLLISGSSSPAVRSYLMLSAMLLAVIADRPALSMRS